MKLAIATLAVLVAGAAWFAAAERRAHHKLATATSRRESLDGALTVAEFEAWLAKETK